MRAVAALAVAATVASGTTMAKDGLSQVPISQGFSPVQMSWDTGALVYDGVWDLVQGKDGAILVCGAGQFKQGYYSQAVRDWLRSGVVKMNGKAILKDLQFVTRVKPDQDLKAATATCKSTGVTPKSSNVEFMLEFPSMRVRQ